MSYEDLRSEGRVMTKHWMRSKINVLRVECVKLRVCKDYFYFTAIPKHYDSTCEMHTALDERRRPR